MIGRCPSQSDRRRRSERGLTLIELVVSVALLTLIGGVVGAAFGVGFKALGTGGARYRLGGAHDQMVFEQLLGRDIARAACIRVSHGLTTYGPYGSCHAGFTLLTGQCTGAALCVAWPQESDSSCHVAVYAPPLSNANLFGRTEYSSASPGTAVSSSTFTSDNVNVVILPPVTVTPPSGPPSWVASVTVKVTNTGVSSGQPTDTLILHPLASDPAGQGAAITTSGPPC